MAFRPRRPAPDGYHRVHRPRQTRWTRARARWPWLARLRPWHALPALAVLAAIFAGYALYSHYSEIVPKGDVLATVDGAPITAADLASEARAAGMLPDQIDQAARKALLQQLVARRLLVGAARARGIDRNVNFLADRARMEEMMLAGAVAQGLAGRTEPDDDAARRYMAAHPAMFAARETITLDAISADVSGIPKSTMDTIDSMDEVVAMLKVNRLPFERATRSVDSASLPPPLVRALTAVKPGKVFLLPQGNKALIGTVVARTPNVAPAAEQLAAARVGVGREQGQARVAAAVKALRAKARIRYAPGLQVDERTVAGRATTGSGKDAAKGPSE